MKLEHVTECHHEKRLIRVKSPQTAPDIHLERMTHRDHADPEVRKYFRFCLHPKVTLGSTLEIVMHIHGAALSCLPFRLACALRF